ncbi:MAG: hypothetical protein GXX85_03105, partial [Ignavibacteria bacterium]|nr:hypothetical protein [Ignavibacteria bacterium]
MKQKVMLLLLLVIAGFTNYLEGHGFGAHAKHFDVIKSMNLPGSYITLIEDARYKPYFIYGSIFPDI